MPGASTLKERRDRLKGEIDELEKMLLKYLIFQKTSQLRTVKLALLYLKKEAKFCSINKNSNSKVNFSYLDHMLENDYVDKVNSFLFSIFQSLLSLLKFYYYIYSKILNLVIFFF